MSYPPGLTPDSGSFQGYTVIACGTLRPELDYLRKTGFLDAKLIIYTPPGLHEKPKELIYQLRERLSAVRQDAHGRAIVVYGDRCYLDYREPLFTIDRVIDEFDLPAARLQAANCIDMIATPEQREVIADGKKIYWMTMGWVLFWKVIFRDWDAGKANETFPAYEKAIVLDPIDAFNDYCGRYPVKVLEFSDWLKIPIESAPVPLNRLKSLLLAARKEFQ